MPVPAVFLKIPHLQLLAYLRQVQSYKSEYAQIQHHIFTSAFTYSHFEVSCPHSQNLHLQILFYHLYGLSSKYFKYAIFFYLFSNFDNVE